MLNKKRSETSRDIQAFRVTINTNCFQHKNSSLLERTKKQYIPLYWHRCKMDQKHIVASREDRLSQLTTTQIDRIIDMEKIKSLLYDRKRHIQDTTFECEGEGQGEGGQFHSNVYEANFLAKVNQIAIQRGIVNEKSGVEEFVGIDCNKGREKEKRSSIKYSKEYGIDQRQKPRAKSQIVQRNDREEQEMQEQEKSIASIQADLDEFEVNLEENKKSQFMQTNRRMFRREEKLLPNNRWFYGMSRRYLDKNKTDTEGRSEECFRSLYDIQSEVREVQSGKGNRKTMRRSTYTTRSSQEGAGAGRRTMEPMVRFRANRLVTIS